MSEATLEKGFLFSDVGLQDFINVKGNWSTSDLNIFVYSKIIKKFTEYLQETFYFENSKNFYKVVLTSQST